MRDPKTKVVLFSESAALSKRLKSQGRTLVTTNGCFDLLHLGHLNYLHEARLLGDVLWVAVNSDASVRALKGPTRLLQTDAVRALQLAALESVDYVTVFEESTPEKFLSVVHPSIHVKGGDYRIDQLPERKVVEAGGGKLQCLRFTEGFSTTALMERIRTSFPQTPK